ncbi:unnamed protein product [Acanthosepion pharaonis]|uniref:Uncharacterized protein n=1 Tax=Acanthosepion pharaonis TaxID=158019 RepID=A0A812EGW7_ACAPH|nr:unnamed protein product [Sepia pharaonis]
MLHNSNCRLATVVSLQLNNGCVESSDWTRSFSCLPCINQQRVFFPTPSNIRSVNQSFFHSLYYLHIFYFVSLTLPHYFFDLLSSLYTFHFCFCNFIFFLFLSLSLLSFFQSLYSTFLSFSLLVVSLSLNVVYHLFLFFYLITSHSLSLFRLHSLSATLSVSFFSFSLPFLSAISVDLLLSTLFIAAPYTVQLNLRRDTNWRVAIPEKRRD